MDKNENQNILMMFPRLNSCGYMKTKVVLNCGFSLCSELLYNRSISLDVLFLIAFIALTTLVKHYTLCGYSYKVFYWNFTYFVETHLKHFCRNFTYFVELAWCFFYRNLVCGVSSEVSLRNFTYFVEIHLKCFYRNFTYSAEAHLKCLIETLQTLWRLVWSVFIETLHTLWRLAWSVLSKLYILCGDSPEVSL